MVSQHYNDIPSSSPSPLAEMAMRLVCHLIAHHFHLKQPLKFRFQWLLYFQTAENNPPLLNAERWQAFLKSLYLSSSVCSCNCSLVCKNLLLVTPYTDWLDLSIAANFALSDSRESTIHYISRRMNKIQFFLLR